MKQQTRATVEGHDIEATYREQSDRLYHSLLGYAGDKEIAREAVAEAFARALAAQDSIREVAPWVWRVAFRIAGQELERGRRLTGLDDSAVAAPEPPDLFEALSQLSARQRAAVILHYYAGYTLPEVAEILGTRKGTIGVHLHRGRARLRQLLEVRDG